MVVLRMKALLTATVQSHICQFHMPLAQMLSSHGYEVHVAARDDLLGKNGVTLDFADKVFEPTFTRTPWSLDNIRAFREMKRIINSGDYDVVHCNTPVGSVVSRLACRKARKHGTKVFYTAHGFHFYKGAPLINWLLYYPVEWICAHFTDVLITINREDFERARKYMHAGRVEYLPGVGVDLKRFADIRVNRREKRSEIGVPENATLLLSVGELNENKNHQLVIRALAEIKDPLLHYVIAGQGPMREELETLAHTLGMADRLHFLGYRRDVAELNQIADAYVLPSFREGLNVSVMEAMASGLPCVVSKIRGNTDLIDEMGGRLFDPYSEEDCRRAIQELLNQKRTELGKHNAEKVKLFSMDTVIQAMEELYGL